MYTLAVSPQLSDRMYCVPFTRITRYENSTDSEVTPLKEMPSLNCVKYRNMNMSMFYYDILAIPVQKTNQIG